MCDIAILDNEELPDGILCVVDSHWAQCNICNDRLQKKNIRLHVASKRHIRRSKEIKGKPANTDPVI